jgi:hypothetical protein
VLILPPGHTQTLRASRRLGRREKWMITAMVGAVAAIVVAVVISVAAGNHSTGNGCVDVNVPYATGGQEIYRCGAAARVMCSVAGTPAGYNGATGRAVAAECRKAGLPVGAG